jgi:hypothetical protein
LLPQQLLAAAALPALPTKPLHQWNKQHLPCSSTSRLVWPLQVALHRHQQHSSSKKLLQLLLRVHMPSGMC